MSPDVFIFSYGLEPPSRRGALWKSPSLSGASGPGDSGRGFGTLPLRSANLDPASRPCCGLNAAGTSGIPALEGSEESARGRREDGGTAALPWLSLGTCDWEGLI